MRFAFDEIVSRSMSTSADIFSRYFYADALFYIRANFPTSTYQSFLPSQYFFCGVFQWRSSLASQFLQKHLPVSRIFTHAASELTRQRRQRQACGLGSSRGYWHLIDLPACRGRAPLGFDLPVCRLWPQLFFLAAGLRTLACRFRIIFARCSGVELGPVRSLCRCSFLFFGGSPAPSASFPRHHGTHAASGVRPTCTPSATSTAATAVACRRSWPQPARLADDRPAHRQISPPRFWVSSRGLMPECVGEVDRAFLRFARGYRRGFLGRCMSHSVSPSLSLSSRL